ncbi:MULTISPECIES: hypothetical protein [unclassified Avibacterium]|uniref:hypothetical protein n=1 Tax=unclassified Avibacterium TaxID=2685287 RepID=UPI0022469A78|nr:MULTISPECIES: hypothetical protein [unclassified Avibacterium]MCW9698088.1 YbjN domain-containing protein [Avibacterium sp. 20-129]MCW9718260.1 YbjN domain-containing protein [Avibacterium sp. 21-599]
MSNQYTADEIKDILLDEGYRSVNILGEDILVLKIDGSNYIIMLYGNGDIQLMYGISGVPMLSLEKVNNWNSNRRLGCLHIVEENQLRFSLGLPTLSDGLSRADIAKGVSRMLEIVRTIDILEFIED